MATDWAQLEWIAAINGMTPDEFIAQGESQQFQNNGVQGTGVAPAVWNAEQVDRTGQAANAAATASTNARLGQLASAYDPLMTASRQRADYVQGLNGQLGAQSAQSALTNNALASQGLADYRTATNNALAWDMGAYNNLVSAANAPMQMTASQWVGPAQSNAADVQRQLSSYNQLQGIANGSLDQTSRAAQAYANAGDIANQYRAARTLEGAGMGELDVNLDTIKELDKLRNPDSIGGVRDLYDVYNGKLDVRAGQEDPEAFKAAHDALGQLKGLTTLQVTPAEKLAYAISQHKQETDEASMRAAIETQAMRRGTWGSGSSIAQGALAAQQTSYNRMLQDMSANAMAQQRAMAALQGYGTLSTNLTAQGNQIAFQNAANRFAGLNAYTNVHSNAAGMLGQIGANNATNNNNRRLAAQEAASTAYATLRAQGFDEAYARGVAADNMANANADRRLGGAQSAGAMSTSMRNASDSMSMFNQSQAQQQSQFADTFAAGRQDAQFGRQVTVADAANRVGRNYMTDQGNLLTGVQNTARDNDTRTQNSIGVQSGLTGQWLGAQQHADSAATTGLGAQAGISQTQLGNTRQNTADNSTFGDKAVARQIQLRGLGNENAATQAGAVALGAPIYGGSVSTYNPNAPTNLAYTTPQTNYTYNSAVPQQQQPMGVDQYGYPIYPQGPV